MIPDLSPAAMAPLRDALGVAAGPPDTSAELRALGDDLERLVTAIGDGVGAVRSPRALAADEMHRRGADALREGRDEDALRDLSRCVELEAHRTGAHLHLAVARVRTGDVLGCHGSLCDAVRHARPATADLAATAALLAARLAVAAGSEEAAVDVLKEADALADCQAVVEALVRLAPEREVRMVELALVHGDAVGPFDRELLGSRSREYETTLRAGIEVALAYRSDLLVTASKLRTGFQALAAEHPEGSAEFARFSSVSAKLYEVFSALHDAPRPTRVSAPDLGALTADARRLGEILREVVTTVHAAQTTAELAVALAGERRRRRGRRRQRRVAPVSGAGGRPSELTGDRSDDVIGELARVDLDGGRRAAVGLRAALELVPTRPAVLVQPLLAPASA